MARKSDEMQWRPGFGVLMSDGTIELVPQDMSRDKWLPKEEARVQEAEGEHMKEFMRDLEKLGNADIDFKDSMREYLGTYEVGAGAVKIIKKAISTHDNHGD